jgi:hypothetical protein
VEITDITPTPAVRTVNDMYPEQREEGVRVDFVVKAANAHVADAIIGRLTESKLTKELRDAEVIPAPDANKGIKLGRASILSVTTSAFATPMYDDNQTWGLENATQNSAYQEYLKSYYRSVRADRLRWPWMDNHMIFGVLGGNNGYEVCATACAASVYLEAARRAHASNTHTHTHTHTTCDVGAAACICHLALPSFPLRLQLFPSSEPRHS